MKVVWDRMMAPEDEKYSHSAYILRYHTQFWGWGKWAEKKINSA